MTKAKQESDGFRAHRATLLKRPVAELVRLIDELYRLSPENRRFLSARLGGGSSRLEEYRKLVADAISPDPFRKGAAVRIAEAKRAIGQYDRATGDGAGTVDLMLTFVEGGTAFAADLGYGDDAFFSSLVGMLTRVLERFHSVPPDVQQAIKPRLLALPGAARNIGWGYCDFVDEAVSDAFPEAG